MVVNIGIISMYGNPIHKGHVKLIKEASELMDEILVIVNNDKQQLLKKGKIIMDEKEREYIIKNIKGVNETFIAIDNDPTVRKSLKKIVKLYRKNWDTHLGAFSKNDLQFWFLNGGSDRSKPSEIPEYEVCKKLNVRTIFGVGGPEKINSSSKINKLRGKE